MGSCYRATAVLFSAVRVKLVIAFKLPLPVEGSVLENTQSLFCEPDDNDNSNPLSLQLLLDTLSSNTANFSVIHQPECF